MNSIRRITIASTIAIPACAALTVVMFFVPAAVCLGTLYVSLAAFIAGGDFALQSKPLAAVGGVTMFAALLAAAFRGLLG
jgi:hypothetical protein